MPSALEDKETAAVEQDQQPIAPYSVFTRAQKRFIVFSASWAGFFSPVSSQIYFPALNSVANDLGVSGALINLTLTSYMVWVRLWLGAVANSIDLPRPLPHVCGRFCG
jgi:hypothetical protein